MADTRCKVVVRRLPPSLQVWRAADRRSVLSHLVEQVPGSPKELEGDPRSGPPSTLQEEAFREAMSDWVERTDWFCYVPGKAR
jgi:hypothetical protein